VKIRQLKLAQKGLLIVVLPVIMQLFLYLELKKQVDDVQHQAQAQEYSRDVMVEVNTVILLASKLFEAYVNLWVVRNNELSARTVPLTKEVRSHLDGLYAMLETHPDDRASAEEIRKRGDAFLRELKNVKLTLDKDDSPLTMWDALDLHQSFGETARGLNTALMKLGIEHTSRVKIAQSSESQARRQLLLFCDVAVGLTLLMAVGLAMFFVKGTVSSLEVLKNNAQRLAAKETLLPPIEGDDEIAAVDQQFHEMARQLTEAYGRLQAVIDTVPMAVIICLENGNIESMNQAGSLLFEYELDELRGQPVPILFEHKEQAENILIKWLDESKDRPLQLEGISKSKESLMVELTVLRFQSPNGVRLLLAVTDIAERYKIEKMKRDFVAMVSHDIRTPLTSIIGNIDMIKAGTEGDITGSALERLDSAQTSADRILDMVTKLLDLERFDSGAFNFELSEFCVADVARKAWEVARPSAKQINWQCEATDIRVYADRDSVEHVIQNFLGNAVKFSPDGGTISCNISANDGLVKVSVSDEGAGVPARYKETIFDRFKQAPQGRGRKDGTGLGLAICKSIVRAVGGQIGVEDNPSGGSIFWFTLPEAPVPTDRADNQRSAEFV
jgi:PAS domain S-box-containing protein